MSSIPHVSIEECIESCGIPTSIDNILTCLKLIPLNVEPPVISLLAVAS